ncbi:glycosyltransferase family 39 protein [Hassallia byssoidea VB512170]|uniref:Glycosyltransferase family 39 protein n=1 Tax=Hassallia byssoidea VB512170 TaxID=1304833 RepID=A0A846H186_9CYAN|nr:glycosyltransferase family 39 protein [Hassalia byssoidea]NEU71133.1 glycosyltransferase family 39 protein [Hassalia byssoidea VB512170]
MKYQIKNLNSLWQQIHLWGGFPYISLLVWILPLLLFNSGNNSLMAHDEGLYAWRSRVMFESGDWINPWSEPHHKTPGPYWMIASSYKLFGISEASVRLTSMIAGILSILLLYEIGKIILSKKLGWLAAAILSVEFLWLQYCRLGTPDVPMICLVLLAIWSFLKAELHPKYRSFYRFIAGLSFGLGFLVRSFMIFLPIVALLPYLIGEHRRHRHLTNPMFYLGFAVGLIPTLSWIWLSSQRFGNNSFEELFRFVFRLGSNDRGDHGILFYFWNVPAKAFPWFFFALLGLVLLVRRPIPRYQLILVGFPLVLFAELSIFSTRLPHYSLALYPFIAMLASVGLDWLGAIFSKRIWRQGDKRTRGQKGQGGQGRQGGELLTPNSSLLTPRFPTFYGSIPHSPTPPLYFEIPRNLSYAFGGLGILLVLAGVVAFAVGGVEIRKYATVVLALGLGWLILPLVWIGRYRFGQKFLTARYWIAGWLIPAWLALAVAGFNGFIGDYNPDVRAFLTQKAIAEILQTNPINFVQVGGKTGVLLNFYTPHHGKQVQQVSQLSAGSYAWISAKQPALSTPHRVLGTVQDYQLIQLGSGE